MWFVEVPDENSPFARFVPMRPPGCCRAINEGNSSGKSVAEREPGALDLTVTMSLRRRLDHETCAFRAVCPQWLSAIQFRWGKIALDGERVPRSPECKNGIREGLA